METIHDLQDFISKLDNEYFKEIVPNIVAEEATEAFKKSFTEKGWDGNPWPQTKKPVKSGSLMVRSGALMASIKPSVVEPERVVISAGSEKVPYARIHQEGGTISHPGGTPYSIVEKNGVKSAVFVSKKKAAEIYSKTGRNLPLTGPHNINIPQRQYMGRSEAIIQRIIASLKEAFNNL